MTRRTIRYLLIFCLLASGAFAAWSWFRPYAWQSDPKARCKVVETMVTRDRSYFWMHVRLKVNPGEKHDLEKPVTLSTATGKILEPADTTFAGTDPLVPSDIWFKFWIESADATGPLKLKLNDGELVVRSGSGVPELDGETFRNFTTQQW
ncbi:MAG: hypothetical protein EOP88_23410 [Verrucomicrobiaceae bacterium]|nr:MAG: hypothetical protein EOP88_23410 [Verrucomicrobiaceae bacterium]